MQIAKCSSISINPKYNSYNTMGTSKVNFTQSLTDPTIITSFSTVRSLLFSEGGLIAEGATLLLSALVILLKSKAKVTRKIKPRTALIEAAQALEKVLKKHSH